MRRAVRAFARAVKAVADLADLPSPDPLTEYHAKEYLEEMETLLVHQLLTAFGSDSDRVELLSAYELEYLAEMVRSVEKEWNED